MSEEIVNLNIEVTESLRWALKEEASKRHMTLQGLCQVLLQQAMDKKEVF